MKRYRVISLSGWIAAAATLVIALDDASTGDGTESGEQDGCVNPCPADVDGNGAVDVVDLLALLGEWGACPDCDGDGFRVVDGDCDDTDPTIHPGATDIPDDGIDQDCDGEDATSGGTPIDNLLAGDLVIAEIMHDPIGNPDSVTDADGEWFEIHNLTATTVNLAGLQVSDSTASFVVTGTVLIEPGGFAVLGRNGETSANGGVSLDWEYGNAFLLNNAGDSLALENSTLTIDTVTYPPFPGGASISLDPDFTNAVSNDNFNNWCSTPPGNSLPGGDLGTAGGSNPNCP